jgi:hypothetical protein
MSESTGAAAGVTMLVKRQVCIERGDSAMPAGFTRERGLP